MSKSEYRKTAILSGSVPAPSHSDREMTHQLKETLVLVGVQLLDHFIVGGAHVTSLAEGGYL